MNRRKNLFEYIAAELPLFWKYSALVAVIYGFIFFFSSFSILVYSLDFLMPLLAVGFGIFIFRSSIGWRKYCRIADRPKYYK